MKRSSKQNRQRRDQLLFSRIAALAAFLAVGAVGVAVLTDPTLGPANPARPPPAPVAVTVAAVVLDDFADHIEAIGTAKAKESVMLSAQVTEVVRAVDFSDGDLIEDGDVLVKLVSREESAQLAEARANLAEARKQYERIAELVKRGNAPRSRLDQQTALRDAAQARMDAVAARLSDRLIRAPFSGILGMRLVSPGTLLEPGDPIATLDDIGTIKLDFPIPEVHLAAVALGQTIKAAGAAYPGRVFEGVVTAISPRVDPVTRAVMIRAEIANPERLLKPGMLLTVQLISRARRSPAVPETALFQIQDRHFVFRVNSDDAAEQRRVMIGVRSSGRVEILDGIEPGDKVVIDGVHRVRDGGPVDVLKDSSSPVPNA